MAPDVGLAVRRIVLKTHVLKVRLSVVLNDLPVQHTTSQLFYSNTPPYRTNL